MIAIEKITCYTHRPQEEGACHATGATRSSTGVVQGAGVQGAWAQPPLRFSREGTGEAGEQAWDWLV